MTSPQSDLKTSSVECVTRPEPPTDELFFDQLKDQFAFFYALTMVAMDAYKQARKSRRQPETELDKPLKERT